MLCIEICAFAEFIRTVAGGGKKGNEEAGPSLSDEGVRSWAKVAGGWATKQGFLDVDVSQDLRCRGRRTPALLLKDLGVPVG